MKPERKNAELECSLCARTIPEGKENCLYCGTMPAPVLEELRVVGQGREKKETKEDHEREGRTEGVWSTSQFGAGVGYPTDPTLAVEFYTNQLMAMKSQRKAPLSKGMKMIIFFVSMLLGGIAVWLMK